MEMAESVTVMDTRARRRVAAHQGPARVLAPVVGGLALLLALIWLIGTALKDPRPHDIPVAIAGPPAAVQQVSTALASGAPGAFKVTSYNSESEARAALDSRSVDGVLVLGAGAPLLIVAGAAGDTSTGVITAAFTGAFKAQGVAVRVETVHPFAAGDAHGLILFFVVVAALVSTLVAQAALGLDRRAGAGPRLAVAGLFAVLAGPAAMGSAAWIAGGYGPGFWPAAGLVALASASAGLAVAGSVRLLGRPGFALAALVVVLLDLVSSGGPAGSQVLPDFYRSLAPWMPAGELYNALRGVLFFDGAAIGRSILVLCGWLLGGLALLLLGELVARRSRRALAAPPAAQ
jgi:hypothetical protein